MADRLPFWKHFPQDWNGDPDLASASLETQGGWIRILGALWDSETRGQKTMTIERWARLLGTERDTANRVISELEACEIANVSRLQEGGICILSRRQVRDYEKLQNRRKQDRERQQRHRERGLFSDITVLPGSTRARLRSSDAQNKEKSSSTKSNRNSQIPDSFKLTPDLTRYARSKGIPQSEVDEVFENFTGYHRAKGSTMRDWSQAFQNWVRRDIEYRKKDGRSIELPGSPSGGGRSKRTLTVEDLFDTKISPQSHRDFLAYLRAFKDKPIPTQTEVVAKFAELDSDVLDGERLDAVGRFLKAVTA